MSTREEWAKHFKVRPGKGVRLTGVPQGATRAAAFVEADHPRHPSGTREGGEFARKMEAHLALSHPHHGGPQRPDHTPAPDVLPSFDLPDLTMDEAPINKPNRFPDAAARQDLKLRIWDAVPHTMPPGSVEWETMFYDVAGQANEGLTTTDRVILSRNANGNMTGILAVQVNDDAVSLMRLGAFPKGYEPSARSGQGGDYHYIDEPPGAYEKGTGTRLMVEAARIAAEENKPLRGLAIPSARTFYERLGMSVTKSPDYDDYHIEWTPEQAREFWEKNR